MPEAPSLNCSRAAAPRNWERTRLHGSSSAELPFSNWSQQMAHVCSALCETESGRPRQDLEFAQRRPRPAIAVPRGTDTRGLGEYQDLE